MLHCSRAAVTHFSHHCALRSPCRPGSDDKDIPGKLTSLLSLGCILKRVSHTLPQGFDCRDLGQGEMVLAVDYSVRSFFF
eukprot:SAG11_NODE_693_length_7696_cov_5.410294_3_plen_80_part_00